MKDSNATVSQLGVLKQKLHSTKAALDEMNEDRNAKLQALLQFIGHLSLACKGQNLELDNKLAKLRHNLGTYERIDDVLPDLVEVERLLKGQYHHVMGQLEEGRSSLSKFSRQLQRVDSMPERLKKEVSYFKQELGKPFHTVWDYIPKVEQLVGFYEQLLDNQFESESPIAVLPKHRQLGHELAQMISNIEFRKDQRDQVLVIKEQLASAEIDIDALLEAYQTILSLLLDNIAREKTASQEFLFALNDALAPCVKWSATLITNPSAAINSRAN